MATIALTDSHCHLDRLVLAELGGSIDSALDLAAAAGVERVLCISVDTSNIEQVVEIARARKNVFASVGVHPMSAHSHPVSVQALSDWADDSVVIAIGETGLDYHYSEETRHRQQESFVTHLEVAALKQLPVVVHTRDARQDTLDLIRSHGSKDSAGVLHCFTESYDMARQALDLGYYISISGIVTFNNASALREVVRKVPLDRLLIETDAPWLAPTPYRGKTNQPAYTRRVAEYIAELRGLDLGLLAQATNDNFDRLFRPPTR